LRLARVEERSENGEGGLERGRWKLSERSCLILGDVLSQQKGDVRKRDEAMERELIEVIRGFT
jgi:hypothetical protein